MRFVINMLTFTRIMGDSIAHPTLIVLSRSDNDFRHDATVRKSLPVEGRVPFHKVPHTQITSALPVYHSYRTTGTLQKF